MIPSSKMPQNLRPVLLFLSGMALMGFLITVIEINNKQRLTSRMQRRERHTIVVDAPLFLPDALQPQSSEYEKSTPAYNSLPSLLQTRSLRHEKPSAVPSSLPSLFQARSLKYEKPAAVPSRLPSLVQTRSLKYEKPAAVSSRLPSLVQTRSLKYEKPAAVPSSLPSSQQAQYEKPTAVVVNRQSFQKWVQTHNQHPPGTFSQKQVPHAPPKPIPPKLLKNGTPSQYAVSSMDRDDLTLPPLLLQNHECNSSICYEYLSKTESVFFDKCTNKTAAKEAKFGAIQKGRCRFMNGTGRYPIALASFPGSGNTWLRGLLEKATGICTGALYCDGGLRTRGFTGEGIRGSSVLAVKDHGAGAPLFSNSKLPRRILDDKPVYGGTILLVRNPRYSLIAEWHRERSKRQNSRTASNHFLYVGAENFGNNSGWNTFLQQKAVRWPVHITTWIVNGRNNPFHLVRYEDLKTNTTGEVQKLLKFLGVPYSEQEINRRLQLGFNDFYRNHHDDFRHFTPEQEHFVSSLVNQTIATLKVYGLDSRFSLQDYL